MSVRKEKVATPPPPLPPSGCAKLLIKSDKLKSEPNYPTMSMILRGLSASLVLALYYFQRDRLWKSVEIALERHRSHDVVDRQWVMLETVKSCLLFSIGYKREKQGNLALFCFEPTISMAEKDLAADHHFLLSSYLIEEQTRSVLALTGSPCVTHDVYEAKGVSLKRPPFDPQPASNDDSLTLAYKVVSLLQQEFGRSTFHKDIDNQDHAGKNKPAQNKDPREVRRVFVRLR